MKSAERVGERYLTNTSGVCTVVQYLGHDKVLVRFEDGFERWCEYGKLRKGQVRNLMIPTFYGKGFIGKGNYGFKDREVYSLWSSMLSRAYSEKQHLKHPTYKDVTVCDEWLNFQNFAEWCYSQKFFNAKDDKGKPYQLDKDILVKGNKVYSPETCCFVPRNINNLLLNSRKVRGSYPVGVYLDKKYQKFKAQLSFYGGVQKHLGYFENVEKAFQTYKKVKESHIKEVAENLKDRVDAKVYQALINWEINTDD